MTKSLDYLAKFARKWRGDLILVDRPTFDWTFKAYDGPAYEDNSPFHLAPFTNKSLGVNYVTKTVYAVADNLTLNGVIHELGHVFADSQDPDHADEYEWLGWEIALAKQAGCYRVWSAENKDYGIADNAVAPKTRDWGYLTATQKAKLAAERVAHAVELGLVSLTGHALALR